jgi:hypothetical protein
LSEEGIELGGGQDFIEVDELIGRVGRFRITGPEQHGGDVALGEEPAVAGLMVSDHGGVQSQRRGDVLPGRDHERRHRGLDGRPHLQHFDVSLQRGVGL